MPTSGLPVQRSRTSLPLPPKRLWQWASRPLKWDPFGKAYLYMDNQEFFHAIEIVEAVRAAVGSSVDLLIEGHGPL